MASPSLKIKLRLTKPKLSESPQSPQSPASPISIKTTVREDDSTTNSPRKKPKTASRNRKPKTESTPVPETPATVDDDNNSTVTDEVTSSKRGGGGGSGGGNQGNANSNNTTTMSGKDILKYKDVKVRHWVNKPLVFRNLDGSEVHIGSWQSDEKMTINNKATEPVTVAEIDQLFSSAGGEKDFRPFLCTQPGCSKSFTTFDQLQTHETNMHGTKKMVCGIEGCHKSFVTTGQLTKHRKMVHFRAARKAKLEAAAAAAEAAAGTSEETSLAATPLGDDESVDIGNSESNL